MYAEQQVGAQKALTDYRSKTPFFHEEDVHYWVWQLAQAQRVVIFAGAGLTIDKTNLGWAELVRQVMETQNGLTTHGLIDAHGAELVCKHLQPVEAATLAQGYYRDLYGNQEDGRRFLLQRLQGLLYPGAYWQAGTLTRNVVRLATTLASSQVNVKIVTTNYETHIEDQYLASLDANSSNPLFPGLSVQVLDKHVKSLGQDNPSSTIELVYLHGRIPNLGDISGRVALTEQDYYDLRQPVTRAMADAFSGNFVVITGSSLTDPPLLASLANTAQDRAFERIALTAMPGYGFYGKLSDADVETMKTHLKARMKYFGVELLFPDYFFQVPQFFEEVITARLMNDSPYNLASASELRYGGRLISWWQEWDRSHLRVENADQRAYEAAQAALEELLTLLPVRPGVRNSATEPLQLEIWVRWNPSEDMRCLALWATSKSVSNAITSPHTIELSNCSSYEPMKAFVSGRPRLETATSTGNPCGYNHDAGTFLSVPVMFDQLAPIPVGVVTLSSPWPRDRTRLGALAADKIEALIDGLRDVGARLVGISALPTAVSR